MHQELKRFVSITEAVFKNKHLHIITIHIPNSYINQKDVQEIKAVKHGANTITILSLVWIRKTNYMSLFVFFISLLIVAQHVSGNHVPIIRS